MTPFPFERDASMTPSRLKPLTALALTALCGALLPGLAQAAAPQPGKVFKDCKDCPEMVVLPAGTFTMGTPDDEVGREPDEGPMHEVTFAKPFAMSRFHVTAGEWDSYVRQTGVKIANGDDRPGRECIASKPRYPQGPRQPAVCMDMDDIKQYVSWLSKKTGHTYQMVSEAQREYAARAGTTGPFPFPFDEGKGYSIAQHANTYGPADGYSYSSPVGSYPRMPLACMTCTAMCMSGWLIASIRTTSARQLMAVPGWSPTARPTRFAAMTGARRRCFHARAIATTSIRRRAGTGLAFGSCANSNTL